MFVLLKMGAIKRNVANLRALGIQQEGTFDLRMSGGLDQGFIRCGCCTCHRVAEGRYGGEKGKTVDGKRGRKITSSHTRTLPDTKSSSP